MNVSENLNHMNGDITSYHDSDDDPAPSGEQSTRIMEQWNLSVSNEDKQIENCIQSVEERIGQSLNPFIGTYKTPKKVKLKNCNNCIVGPVYNFNLSRESPSEEISASPVNNVLEIISPMKLYYSTVYSHMKSLFWDGEGYDYPLKNYFIDLMIDEDDLMGYSKVCKDIQLEEIFQVDELCNRILITAEPGFGKTTLTKKLAYDWALEKSYMSKFDLVLILPLRQLGDRTVYEALCDIVVKGTKISTVLKNIEFSLLILLDGFDELLENKKTLEFIQNESFKINKNLTILITSRPHAVPKIRKLFHRRLTISGFSKENQHTYIERVLNPEQCQQIISLFDKNDFFSSVSKCPLILHMLCFLHKDSGNLPKSMDCISTIYVQIINLFMKRYENKHQNKHLEQGDFLLGERVLIKLCSGITPEVQDNFVFISNEDLKNMFTAEEYNMIVQLDFLISTTNIVNSKEIITFEFLHRTFFEFIYAVYLIQNKLYKDIMDIFLNCLLDSIFLKDHTVRFLCGLMKNKEEFVSKLINLPLDIQDLYVWNSYWLSVLVNECNKDLLNHFCSKIKFVKFETLGYHYNDLQYILQHCPLKVLMIPLDHSTIKYFPEERFKNDVKTCKSLDDIDFKIKLDESDAFWEEQQCYIDCSEIFRFTLNLSTSIKVRANISMNCYSTWSYNANVEKRPDSRKNIHKSDIEQLIGLDLQIILASLSESFTTKETQRVNFRVMEIVCEKMVVKWCRIKSICRPNFANNVILLLLPSQYSVFSPEVLSLKIPEKHLSVIFKDRNIIQIKSNESIFLNQSCVIC